MINPRPPRDGVKLHRRSMQEISHSTFYEGEWNSDGQRHGYGLCIYLDKTLSLYEGFWAYDKPRGRGRRIDECF